MSDSILENKIKDCERTIDELSRKLYELKQQVKQKDINDIPVDEIPCYFTKDEYDKYMWVVDYDGRVLKMPSDNFLVGNARYFLNSEDAKEFQRKTSFIAKCMYFKRKYDRDFIPDWNNQSQHKWYLMYDHFIENYRILSAESLETSLVYFSSKDIAKKCLEWINYIDKLSLNSVDVKSRIR